jgi:NAD(P)H-dependent FMN reductase
MALNIALQGARGLGAETHLVELGDYDLPFVGALEDEDSHPGVVRLRNDIRAADGLIIGTPEYHGSYSGVLKNALDLMGFDEFEGKVVGLVGVAGGKLGGVSALDSLRTIGRSLHAWVIPEQVGIPEAKRQFDPDGTLRDDRLRGRLLALGTQVARFAFLHTPEHAMEFLRLWEKAAPNPGGTDGAAV